MELHIGNLRVGLPLELPVALSHCECTSAAFSSMNSITSIEFQSFRASLMLGRG